MLVLANAKASAMPESPAWCDRRDIERTHDHFTFIIVRRLSLF